jgi:hypothetical protein
MQPLNVLVGCEQSCVVRDAFAKLGHNAWSCDLLEAEGNHYQCDVVEVMDWGCWDLFIVHPSCQFLSSSGLHHNKNNPDRQLKTEEAVLFAKKVWNAKVAKICMENPIGRLGTTIGKATQIIQPHQFGHDASKSTCLWLKGLPKLIETKHIAPRIVDGKPRWANQTDSGQNRLPPSADRWKIRSRTYYGIAEAMASQWGGICSL